MRYYNLPPITKIKAVDGNKADLTELHSLIDHANALILKINAYNIPDTHVIPTHIDPRDKEWNEVALITPKRIKNRLG